MKKLLCLLCVCLLLVSVLTGCTSHISSQISVTENTTETTFTTTKDITQTTANVTTTIETKATTIATVTNKTTKKTTEKSTTARVTTVSAETRIREVYRLVNEERAKAGVAPLSYYAAAQAVADLRAKEAAEKFSHYRPDGTAYISALDAINISYNAAAENLARGQTSSKEVMQDWMDSQGHRESILNEKYTAIAVGYYEKNGVSYWVQIFLGF